MGKKKNYIDKKNSHTIDLTPYMGKGKVFDDNFKLKDDSATRLSQQIKHGIYFEDDYNYLQHLKSSLEYDPNIVSVLQLKADEKILKQSIENKEIINDNIIDINLTFEENFDFENPENLLENDFIMQANDFNTSKFINSYTNENDLNIVGSTDSQCDSESTHNSDIEYGISSNINDSSFEHINNNTELDEKFEQVYQMYDDDNIGGLSEKNSIVDGDDNCESNLQTLLENQEMAQSSKKWDKFIIDVPKDSPHIKKYIYEQDETENLPDDLSSQSEESIYEEKYDVESILSIQNDYKYKPILVCDPLKKIRISRKNRLPLDDNNDVPRFNCQSLRKSLIIKGIDYSLNQLDLDKSNMNAPPDDMDTNDRKYEDRQQLSNSNQPIVKDKDANRERKKNLKEDKRQRRSEKKVNKLNFKKELDKERLQRINTRLNHQSALKLA
ncbi:protein LTV1 homolog isoform X2 [Gordionus sp. m RMFG-2023]|uniref:protein LTV1 homolog isoform X2 n=1 Tax=Gordionus sp. m RMFG-2023 TaxID=3053472 RepID=UPI0031FD8349